MVFLAPTPLPAPQGTVTLPLPIPNDPTLLGKTLYVQALVLHSANLSEARLTNVLAEAVHAF